MRRILLTAALLGLMPGVAQAQSMNIPLIVETTLTQVCGPWMQTGDRAAAVRAAQTLGYVAYDRRTGEAVTGDDLPPSMVLDGSLRHRGRIFLIESRDRVCAVDMAEAGPAQIAEAAAPHLREMGLQQAFHHGGPIGAVVWTGRDRQAVMAPSYASSGATLVVSWLRPDAASD